MKSLLSLLTLALCGTALVLLPVVGIIIQLAAKQLLEENFDAVLAAKADALLTTAEVNRGKLEIDFEVQEFAGFGSAAGGDYFEFRSPDGSLLGRSPSLRRDRLPEPEEKPERRPHAAYMKLPDGREGRILWQAMPIANKDDGPDMTVELGVASDSETLRQTLHTLAVVLTVTLGTGLALTVVVFRRVVRHALQPVEEMARKVQEIDVADRVHVLNTAALPTELTPVGKKVNDLLARARQAMERERSFSSHAAHELRTPLAELRAMTELMALWTDEATPERCEEMQAVISRLEGLLQKLSHLAKADAGQLTVQREAVDLQGTLQAAVDRFAAEAASKGLQVSLKASPSASPNAAWMTDPVLWEAIINNLLENAISYAPRESTIEIQASHESLRVKNAAPALTQADLERVADRFWRKDTARTAESEGHSGLGLALVTAYVELLGGRCSFQLEGSGTNSAGAPHFVVEVRWHNM